MKKTSKLVKKLELLLKQLNLPRFLHHFGPRKYELKQHLFALMIKERCKLSFRSLEKVFDIFDEKIPTYSALCKSRKRIPLGIWNSLLKSTADKCFNVAVDGTGISLTNPSQHYLKRIDRLKPSRTYTKLSALYDVEKKKFVSIRVRVKPRHDIMDVMYLLKRAGKIRKLYADRGYDSEKLHEWCYKRNIQTYIKKKEWTRRGYFRRRQLKNFSNEEYGKRNLVESGFSAFKRKYGNYNSAKSYRTIQGELYCRAIAYNLGLCWIRFSTEPFYR